MNGTGATVGEKDHGLRFLPYLGSGRFRLYPRLHLTIFHYVITMYADDYSCLFRPLSWKFHPSNVVVLDVICSVLGLDVIGE